MIRILKPNSPNSFLLFSCTFSSSAHHPAKTSEGKRNQWKWEKNLQFRSYLPSNAQWINYKKKDAPPSDCNGDRVVTVSEFDYCVDNHFRAIETISKLCGEDDEDYYALQQTEIQRLSSSLTFLKSILNNAPPNFKFYVCMYVCMC